VGGLTRITAPSLDPVSLSEAKEHCRIDSDESDGSIVGYILAARQFVEKVTGRMLIDQRWALTLDRCWPRAWDGACYRTRIVVPLPPLTTVTSITYVDTAGVTQTLAANQYRVILRELFGFIEPAYSVSWPAVRDQSDAITVTFNCGYGTNPGDVPEPLRMAILLHVEMLNDRDPDSRDTLERARDALLQPYKTEGWI
jgi:uncharacterized phiE125 gp8 family phage protein